MLYTTADPVILKLNGFDLILGGINYYDLNITDFQNLEYLKCLSLKQPYAELLATGRKTIEIRKWNTNFRGIFLIHSSKNINKDACLTLGIDETNLVKGAIIGKALLYKVIKYSSKEIFLNDRHKHFSIEDVTSSHSLTRYGFLIKDAVRFKEEIPYLGKLGFFEVADLHI